MSILLSSVRAPGVWRGNLYGQGLRAWPSPGFPQFPVLESLPSGEISDQKSPEKTKSHPEQQGWSRGTPSFSSLSDFTTREENSSGPTSRTGWIPSGATPGTAELLQCWLGATRATSCRSHLWRRGLEILLIPPKTSSPSVLGATHGRGRSSRGRKEQQGSAGDPKNSRGMKHQRKGSKAEPGAQGNSPPLPRQLK